MVVRSNHFILLKQFSTICLTRAFNDTNNCWERWCWVLRGGRWRWCWRWASTPIAAIQSLVATPGLDSDLDPGLWEDALTNNADKTFQWDLGLFVCDIDADADTDFGNFPPSMRWLPHLTLKFVTEIPLGGNHTMRCTSSAPSHLLDPQKWNYHILHLGLLVEELNEWECIRECIKSDFILTRTWLKIVFFGDRRLSVYLRVSSKF